MVACCVLSLTVKRTHAVQCSRVACGLSDHPQNRRAVVVHRTQSASIIGAATRWVVWIIVFFALFTGVLEHFIGFSDYVGQRHGRFVIKRQLLNSMSPIQHRLIVQFQFVNQLEGWCPLEYHTSPHNRYERTFCELLPQKSDAHS
jgi:hypothetical protein